LIGRNIRVDFRKSTPHGFETVPFRNARHDEHRALRLLGMGQVDEGWNVPTGEVSNVPDDANDLAQTRLSTDTEASAHEVLGS
jgi:hypothetical protein